MSTSVGLQELPEVWSAPPSTPLDEGVWQAWMERGRARDRRDTAARLKAVEWASITVLLVAAGLWSQLTPYEIVVRFLVAAGAIFVMFQAFHVRHYALGATFAALALLFNPVAPLFSFSGGWQRALVVASAIPFVVSLAWRNTRVANND
jgi:hypothetical protein